MSLMGLVTAISLVALVSVSCGNPAAGRGESPEPLVGQFQDGHFIPKKPMLSFDRIVNLKELTDVLRVTDPDIEHLLGIPALTAVTHEFGPSVIAPQTFPMHSAVGQSSIVPWSSWWYPKKENYLFYDSSGRYSSALTKYDLIRLKRWQKAGGHGAKPGSAASYESQGYNSNALPWEGLCDAWSWAAISAKEPKHPVTMTENGISVTFKISDLKGLLLMTYAEVPDSDLKYYGQKFTGDENGWVFPNVFPDQFHRFLEMRLFNQQQPFIMDHDPGVEVWNVPVFKANYKIDTIPGQPNAVFVQAWVFSAESVQTNEREYVGTKSAVREYNYVLQGTRDGHGNLVIDSGYWVLGPDGVDSRAEHPDYLTSIPNAGQLQRKSSNPEIDVQLVDEILARSY